MWLILLDFLQWCPTLAAVRSTNTGDFWHIENGQVEYHISVKETHEGPSAIEPPGLSLTARHLAGIVLPGLSLLPLRILTLLADRGIFQHDSVSLESWRD